MTSLAGANGKEAGGVPDLPRVVFAGRSNVGKSSLINSLVGRKKLAHTSSTPGRTRAINLFNINNQWIFRRSTRLRIRPGLEADTCRLAEADRKLSEIGWAHQTRNSHRGLPSRASWPGRDDERVSGMPTRSPYRSLPPRSTRSDRVIARVFSGR